MMKYQGCWVKFSLKIKSFPYDVLLINQNNFFFFSKVSSFFFFFFFQKYLVEIVSHFLLAQIKAHWDYLLLRFTDVL